MDEKKIKELEEQISNGRGRLSADRMDLSFGELISLYKNKELIIRPEYQRFFRWNQQQKTALIESILLSIPIPPIFVAEDEDGIWELVDGLQRVSTFISFFGELDTNVSQSVFQRDNEEEMDNGEEISINNKWTLEEGGLIPGLEGFDIETLPSKYKMNLKRAVCRVEILRGESSHVMKYELFKRLNSGGSKATAQEIRNAVYRGINSTINELIIEISNNDAFQKLTNLSKQKKQELYDQELVLRFIAYLGNVEKINKNTEAFLNDFMQKNAVEKSKFDPKYYREMFNKVLKMIERIDDAKVFRNHKNQFVPAYFEGIIIGLAQNIERYDDQIELLKTKINKLKNDEEFKRVSGVASNSKTRIRARLRRANKIFGEQ
ncbi:MAG: DUF262 domain-containing protein [Deltaproteobacteria bacterium]|nr:DUF262 domain-containing protein [Deltaproteobacteria bacterium]